MSGATRKRLNRDGHCFRLSLKFTPEKRRVGWRNVADPSMGELRTAASQNAAEGA